MRVLRNGIEFSELSKNEMNHILGGNPNGGRRGNGRGDNGGGTGGGSTVDITRGGDVEGDPDLDLD